MVFTTKNRYPFLNNLELRKKMWRHIKENASEKGIYIAVVNGYMEHCHCLVSLNRSHSIQETAQLIKGESSFWINKSGLLKEKFQWQNEYFAVSVGDSEYKNVLNYILNQEKHHAKLPFQDEHESLLEKF
jgi:REP element-mobilizing transposase RayT